MCLRDSVSQAAGRQIKSAKRKIIRMPLVLCGVGRSEKINDGVLDVATQNEAKMVNYYFLPLPMRYVSDFGRVLKHGQCEVSYRQIRLIQFLLSHQIFDAVFKVQAKVAPSICLRTQTQSNT